MLFWQVKSPARMVSSAKKRSLTALEQTSGHRGTGPGCKYALDYLSGDHALSSRILVSEVA